MKAQQLVTPTIDDITLAALENLKALEITRLDVRKLTSITNTLFICTGTSDRHCQSIADSVVEAAKKNGHMPLGEERDGGWILVDLGEVVVHIMRQEVRDFYNLEKLWASGEIAKNKTSAK